MSNFRNKKVNFSQIPNTVLRGNTLSRKAKGLYCEIYSYITIPDFKLSKSYLMNKGEEGESAFNSMWKELKDKGYLKQYRIRVPKGQSDSVNGFIYEYDLLDEPDTSTPYLINIKIDGTEGKKEESKNDELTLENQRVANEENLENIGIESESTLDFVPTQFCTTYNPYHVQDCSYINNTEVNNTELNNTSFNKKERKKERKSEIDVNFENLWKLLKAHPNDRKSKVTKKRKKELYEMGYERVEKAINLYLKIQNPEYYHKRDNILNEIIDNYIDKTEKDFNVGVEEHTASYDISEYEKQTESIPANTNNQVDTNSKEISDYDWYEIDMKPGEDDYLSKKLAELRKNPEKAIGF